MQPGNPVVGGTVLRRAAIQSPNFVSGSAGWTINADGSAQFNGSVTITNGSLTVTFSDGSVITISPTGVGVGYTAALVNSLLLLSRVVGDTGNRFDITASGILQWGSGTGATDTDLFRNGVKALGTHGELDFVNASAAGNTVIGMTVVGDTVNRLALHADGTLFWGSGSAAADTSLFRDVANVVGVRNQFRVYGLAGNDGLRVGIAGEALLRFTVDTTGGIGIGDGTNPADVFIYRRSTAQVGVTGDLAIDTAGRGLLIKEGTNAKMGRAVLGAGGTVVVNTTKVTASSEIFLTTQIQGGTVGAPYVSARTPGTSFTITSTNNLDTSTVAWLIVEPS